MTDNKKLYYSRQKLFNNIVFLINLTFKIELPFIIKTFYNLE